MAAPDLKKLQRTTFRLLSSTMDLKKLRTNCPLDYGRHILNLIADLGRLKSLPVELQHHVLGLVDIRSLLTFRQVNQSAMIAMDGMTEYYKVLTLAPDCIRMALGIQTAHSFTIKKLFSKLCQRQCDGKGCKTLAPYLDVFMLTRRCLSISGGCPFPLSPLNIDTLEECFYTHDMELPNHSFLPLPGCYQYGADGHTVEIPGARNVGYYDYGEVKAALWSEAHKRTFEAFDRIAAKDDLYWRLCSVSAPWLDKLGLHAEYGVFCGICGKEELQGAEDTGENSDESSPHLSMVPFMRLSDLAEHMEKEHVGDVTQYIRLVRQEAQ